MFSFRFSTLESNFLTPIFLFHDEKLKLILQRQKFVESKIVRLISEIPDIAINTEPNYDLLMFVYNKNANNLRAEHNENGCRSTI